MDGGRLVALLLAAAVTVTCLVLAWIESRRG